MKKYLLGWLAPVLLTGCPPIPAGLPSVGFAPGSASMQVWTLTTVDLSKKNYRIVKTNAVGSSRGFKLLGVIPLKSVNYVNAIANLYQDAGITEGRAYAVANVVYQKRSPFFILFSLPKLTLRADLVEFVDESLPEDGLVSPEKAIKSEGPTGEKKELSSPYSNDKPEVREVNL